jgi:hypothetical protein
MTTQRIPPPVRAAHVGSFPRPGEWTVAEVRPETLWLITGTAREARDDAT